MEKIASYSQVRAVYHNGVLSPVEPLDLPEGSEVWLDVQLAQVESEDKSERLHFVYPTRAVPAEVLDKLTGIISLGGDALADSEALYDPDWP